MMSQPPKFEKKPRLSRRGRLIAVVVFIAIAAGAAILWASGMGFFSLKPVFGVCGFKQRFDLPCPGCGWTHAGEAFFTGHVIEAFRIQPAAAFFSLVSVAAAIFALHCALFGIDFGLLQYVSTTSGISILLISAIGVILGGWVVNLIRTILEN